MNVETSRICLTVSLILSLISFILSLTAFYLPYWKSIQLRSTSLLPGFLSDDNQMDPLIRGELEKYMEMLYRRGDRHSIGLLTHCLSGGTCGQNLLPSFDKDSYEHCHDIKLHHECIFSNSISSNRCTCEKPFYMKTSYFLLIVALILQGSFLFANFLRLCRRPYYFYNDLHFRIIAIVSSLFSFLCLLIIIIEQNRNRLLEPSEFFQSMHRHYSRVQIYAFSNHLETILKQVERDLDVRLGAAYVCLIIVLICTFISFVTSSTVEIEILSYHEENNGMKRKFTPPPIERFVSSESNRFGRQTKMKYFTICLFLVLICSLFISQTDGFLGFGDKKEAKEKGKCSLYKGRCGGSIKHTCCKIPYKCSKQTEICGKDKLCCVSEADIQRHKQANGDWISRRNG